MSIVRTTINLTQEQRDKLMYYHIESLREGKAKSLSKLVGDAVDRCYTTQGGADHTRDE